MHKFRHTIFIFCVLPISFLSAPQLKRVQATFPKRDVQEYESPRKSWQLPWAAQNHLCTLRNRKSANPGWWATLESSKMASRKYVLSVLTANFLIPIAILIFARGFFPYKPFLSGLAKYEGLSWPTPPEAPFNKVVFMVVDALRR